MPALSFVHWYTRHPSAPPPPPLEKIERVAIVGQGNVALDVARMLLAPLSHLEKYDVPASVLDVLSRSAVKHVSIIGRRGPYQAAFTTKEIRELLTLPNASLVPMPADMLTPPEGMELTRQQGRMIDLLRKGPKQAFGTTPRTWSLDFWRAPTGLVSLGANAARLHLAHTMLDPETERAVPTGETSSLDAGLVVPALGHHAEAGAPWVDPVLKHVRTTGPGGGGRVISSAGRHVRNVYASGWASMGARGVIAKTLLDAHEVAAAILEDAYEPREDDGVEMDSVMANDVVDDQPPAAVQEGIAKGTVTTYEDWKKVDDEEVRIAAATGKERERMVWDEAKGFLGRQ
jgi:adrenodoxin-NADP+ reductase